MADVREEINAIKLDEKYLFAEATDAEPNKAFESALYELTIIINDAVARGKIQSNHATLWAWPSKSHIHVETKHTHLYIYLQKKH